VLAQLLSKRGALVSLADVNEKGLAETIQSLENSSSHLSTVVDVRKSASVDSWISKTIEKFGKLDGAANWAGVIRINPVVEVTDEDWNFVMDVNSTGVFNCIRAQLRVMKDGASIVSNPCQHLCLFCWANSVARYRRRAPRAKLAGRHSRLTAPASMPLLA
jgi:NAD(P)-dependent dehydrogenase (short-subunit alcohol dehydrogenase family)